MRLLAVEGVGLVLPTLALGLLTFNKWIWLGGVTVESKLAAIIPADYMPAVYWDGMGASMHSLLIMSIAITALMCVVITAFTFFSFNEQFFEHCHKWVEKHICRNPLWKLWLGYWGILGVEMVFCVIVLLAAFVGIGDEWLEIKESNLGGYFLTSAIWLAMPWAVVMLPIMVIMFLMYLPFFSFVVCPSGLGVSRLECSEEQLFYSLHRDEYLGRKTDGDGGPGTWACSFFMSADSPGQIFSQTVQQPVRRQEGTSSPCRVASWPIC